MNWDAIGAGAELLGALATVATLAYLALQIRLNTKMAQVSTATARAEQRQQMAEVIASALIRAHSLVLPLDIAQLVAIFADRCFTLKQVS